MGVFSDDEEEKDEAQPSATEVYCGAVCACPECEHEFRPGDMLHVVATNQGQVPLCYRDPDSFEVKVLGKEICLDAWRTKTGNNTIALPMVFRG